VTKINIKTSADLSMLQSEATISAEFAQQLNYDGVLKVK